MESSLLYASLGKVSLEDTFWSPWPWTRRSSPWPWPRSPRKCPVLGSRTALFWFVKNGPLPWSSFHFTLEKGRNLAENLRRLFSFFLRTPDFSRKIGVSSRKDLFFFWEHLRLVFLASSILSLALRISVLEKSVLGLGFFFVPLASKVVSLTPPLNLIRQLFSRV